MQRSRSTRSRAFRMIPAGLIVTATVAFVVAAVGVPSAQADSPDPATPTIVTISDPALAACTTAALGAPVATTSFTVEDLASITSLTCPGVADASQLSLYSGLSSLNLDAGTISDISSLANLSGLTSLSLADDDITDVTPVRYLRELRTLSLSGNHISDRSSLWTLNTTTIDATGQTVTGAPMTYGETFAQPVIRYDLNSQCDVFPSVGTDYVYFSPDNLLRVTSTTAGAVTWTCGFRSFTGTYSFASALGILTPPSTSVGVDSKPVAFSTVRATPGEWQPYQVDYAYQWYRNGIAISGATSGWYTPKATDVGAELDYTVTVSLPDYATQSRTSPTYRVAAAPFAKASTPAIGGVPHVGHVVTATHGPWSPSGIAFTYRWNRDGKPIAGATKPTYKLSGSDAHHAITVTVTGAKAGYAATSKTSPSIRPTFH